MRILIKNWQKIVQRLQVYGDIDQLRLYESVIQQQIDYYKQRIRGKQNKIYHEYVKIKLRINQKSKKYTIFSKKKNAIKSKHRAKIESLQKESANFERLRRKLEQEEIVLRQQFNRIQDCIQQKKR